MRVIPSSEVRMTPMHCAVVPTIGQTSGRRFIDTGYDMYVNSVNMPNRIYVSEPAVGEMARKFGWTSPDDAQALAARVTALEKAVAAAEREKEELEQRFGAIDVLASAGFVARKKPGRPASEKQVA
jgi:NAD(P)-dependent dehydrogenase (short-subunit alcohol dehydrogenase family)